MQAEPKTYYDLTGCDKPISIHQGGTSSGKTYSILKVLLRFAYDNRGSQPTTVSIVRKSLPALKKSVLRDFLNILASSGIEYAHNKTDQQFKVFNTTFEFFSLDDPQKARGPRRDVLYCNEANELTYEDFRQLNMRTKMKTVIDFNPSEEYWAHTELVGRDDVSFFKSNYLDNPYLDERVKAEIERLRDADENFWRIYGLGELGVIEGLVLPNWAEIDQFPVEIEHWGCGLDFGYTNDPSALIKIGIKDDRIYLEELVYERGLTNDDLAARMAALGLPKHIEIVADSAEPKSIEEIYRKGWNIKPTAKGADSILRGIDELKMHKLHVTNSSTNLLKELKNYKWQRDKNGNWLNRPIDAFNHAIDAIRYYLLVKPRPLWLPKIAI